MTAREPQLPSLVVWFEERNLGDNWTKVSLVGFKDDFFILKLQGTSSFSLVLVVFFQKGEENRLQRILWGFVGLRPLARSLELMGRKWSTSTSSPRSCLGGSLRSSEAKTVFESFGIGTLPPKTPGTGRSLKMSFILFLEAKIKGLLKLTFVNMLVKLIGVSISTATKTSRITGPSMRPAHFKASRLGGFDEQRLGF